MIDTPNFDVHQYEMKAPVQPMSMEQMRKEKSIVDCVIRDAIRTFESRTGCFIKSVNIERIFMMNEPALLGGVRTDVEL